MKNILVQYKGGCYDGCFWEWNFFAFDSQGNFHNIAASGIYGIKTLERALELLQDKDSEHYIYNLPDDFSKFTAASNKVHIAGVCKFFEDSPDFDFVPEFECDICGHKSRYEYETQLIDWHGCGGIAMTADRLICQDCVSTHTCFKCNEFSDDMKGEYCSDCFDEKVKEIVACPEICFNRFTNELYLEYDTDFRGRVSDIYLVTILSAEGYTVLAVESEAERCAIEDAITVSKVFPLKITAQKMEDYINATI